MNTVLEDYKDFAAHFALYEELRGKTIAITGATGLIGGCMVGCLKALNEAYSLGLTIICIVRDKDKAQAMLGRETSRLVYIVHDFSADEPLIIEGKVDFLMHLASPTASKYFVSHPVETMLTGLRGTVQVLDFAREHGLQSVVYASSVEMYGTLLDDSEPLTEDKQGYLDPMQTRSSYPMAKRAAECLCHAYAEEYGVAVKTARLAQTFGAGVGKDDNRVFAQFARSAIGGQDIVLKTTGQLAHCYCYTTDAVEGLLYILLRGKDGEAYNVANEKTYASIREMAEMVCREFNTNIHTIIQVDPNAAYPPTTKHRQSSAKLRALGWAPRYDLTAMYRRLIASFNH